MEVKTDTKEKYHVIGVNTPHISANMTDELSNSLVTLLQTNNKNVVLKLKEVKTIDEQAAEALVKLQQRFYEANASFVICEMNADIEDFLDKKELLELLNLTPTESEAADIVQMEEIERELMDEEDTPDPLKGS
ncbi:MAG: STAS domain-containing protein [Chitinophagaceae bacterium]